MSQNSSKLAVFYETYTSALLPIRKDTFFLETCDIAHSMCNQMHTIYKMAVSLAVCTMEEQQAVIRICGQEDIKPHAATKNFYFFVFRKKGFFFTACFLILLSLIIMCLDPWRTLLKNDDSEFMTRSAVMCIPGTRKDNNPERITKLVRQCEKYIEQEGNVEKKWHFICIYLWITKYSVTFLKHPCINRKQEYTNNIHY